MRASDPSETTVRIISPVHYLIKLRYGRQGRSCPEPFGSGQPSLQQCPRGFVYLAAVIDWFSRKVLAWRLSITLSADFCIEALEDALGRYGRPEIFNSDQGSQFTSVEFIKVLKNAEIAISMDGKGAWRDNVFVERLWRTVKYEEVYLRAYGSVSDARASIVERVDQDEKRAAIWMRATRRTRTAGRA